MKLRSYLLFATIAFFVLGTATAARLVFTTQMLRQATETVEVDVKGMHAAEQIELALLDNIRECFLAGITGDAKHIAKKHASAERLRTWLTTMDGYVRDPEERRLYEQVNEKIQAFLERQKQWIARGISPWTLYETASESFDGVYGDLQRLIQIHIDAVGVNRRRIQTHTRIADIAGVVVIVAFLLFGMALLLAGRRLVYGPIVALEQSIGRFAAGDLACRAKPCGTAEIRNVTQVFNAMAAKLQGQRENQLRFLAAVAHDLRNPLNAMVMSIDLMSAEDAASADEHKEMLAIISRQVKRLDRMVGDLLDTAQIEAGHLELKLEALDLVALAQEAVGLFKTLSPQHRIRLTNSTARIAVHGDALRLSQVLNNLISNAVKYSPEGGEVKVDVSLEPDAAVIAVTDQGIGIAPDDLARLFRPFQRGSATRAAIQGVGLGLSVSKRITEAHGGCIEVGSILGQGSTFRVRLPLSWRIENSSPSETNTDTCSDPGVLPYQLVRSFGC